tara:strand:+ start:101 stop:598 length:498 start_codon:yes stop_codon:yes gene_type:complete
MNTSKLFLILNIITAFLFINCSNYTPPTADDPFYYSCKDNFDPNTNAAYSSFVFSVLSVNLTEIDGMKNELYFSRKSKVAEKNFQDVYEYFDGEFKINYITSSSFMATYVDTKSKDVENLYVIFDKGINESPYKATFLRTYLDNDHIFYREGYCEVDRRDPRILN